MADTKRPIPDLAPRQKRSSSQPPASERWETETDLMKTMRMGSAPELASIPKPALVPRVEPGGRALQPPAVGAAPTGVELLVVEESQLTGGERKPWRAAEVWTKRRVYGLDSTFKCVEILDRETGKVTTGHDMLGARLGGGRLRLRDSVRFSYPLPLPGMEAMFLKGKKHGYTSAIERMIVRIRVLQTGADEASPSWEDIASRWSEPPPR